ncbi:MAG TPA: FAD-dependent oxidoreductase, partial [Xanthomonadales bacterium]|nr:FAD-dependent oxidoreductase [Xanthomonadales bacterium]
MELASAGISVDLYDMNDRCLAQASAQNEGKIHLGYVYANDRTLRTARTMVKGAIAFSPLMRRWLGTAIDTVPVSTPFCYLVHAESLLGVEDVERHLRHAHEIALDESRGAEPEYFGSDYRVPPARIGDAEADSLFDRRSVKAAYRTPEIAVDPEALASAVRARLAAEPKINCVLQARVNGVRQADAGLTIVVDIAGERARVRYDHVVNALADGRLAVDETVGLQPERPWLYRVKHYVRLRAPGLARVPSTTIVLGPFGDIAAYGDGNFYLSWYPAGMRGMSTDLSPPAWPLVLDETASSEVRRAIVGGLARVVPALTGLSLEAVESGVVKGGIIFAWGRTDIHDPASGLHERHAIGPVS